MLVLLRLLFGAVLLYEMMEGARKAPDANEAGDLTGASYLVVCVVLGILNALVWAPYLGAKVSGPLTGFMTESTYVDRVDWILRLIRWLDARGWRRAVLLLCFWEGIRYPSSPVAFVVGLKNARAGSWLEKIYAREVFRSNNTQNAIQAYLALKRHGIDPRPHRNQEVNIILLSLEKPPRPEPAIIAVPAGTRPAPLKRNPRIRLFQGANRPTDQEATPERPRMENVLLAPAATTSERSAALPEKADNRAARLFGRLAALIRAH